MEKFEEEVESIEQEEGYWHYKSARLRRYKDAMKSVSWYLHFK